jgi:hypothetical protein
MRLSHVLIGLLGAIVVGIIPGGLMGVLTVTFGPTSTSVGWG